MYSRSVQRRATTNQFDQESNYPLRTPFSTTKKLNTTTTMTQTLSKPNSSVSITRIGAAQTKQNPSRPRVKSTHIPTLPQHWLNRFKSSSSTPPSDEDYNQESSVDVASKAAPDSRRRRRPNTSPSCSGGFKWPKAGSKDSQKSKEVETQQHY